MAKFFSSFVATLVLLSMVNSQCNYDVAKPFFRRSIYEFSLRLTTRVSQESDNHFVISPFSIWTLISSLSLAAEGETLNEIKDVLRLHPHECFNKKFFEIARDIISNKRDVTLERASLIFIDNKALVKDEFVSSVLETEVSNVTQVSFDDPIDATNRINEFVKEATHGYVDSLASPFDLQGAYVFLVDVLYFKGRWQLPFASIETEVSTFYDEKGNPIGDVDLMFAGHDLNLVNIDAINAQVLELPYGTEGRYSMLLVLPKDGPVMKTLDLMKNIDISSIYILFKEQGPTYVDVQIPRFQISSDVENLKELLGDMGLNSMFQSSAEFPHLSEYEAFVGHIVQKASIEVTEEGTTATAASGADVQFRALPEQFVANKPFAFMIVDKLTNMMLFSGVYSKPEMRNFSK